MNIFCVIACIFEKQHKFENVIGKEKLNDELFRVVFPLTFIVHDPTSWVLSTKYVWLNQFQIKFSGCRSIFGNTLANVVMSLNTCVCICQHSVSCSEPNISASSECLQGNQAAAKFGLFSRGSQLILPSFDMWQIHEEFSKMEDPQYHGVQYRKHLRKSGGNR